MIRQVRVDGRRDLRALPVVAATLIYVVRGVRILRSNPDAEQSNDAA